MTNTWGGSSSLANSLIESVSFEVGGGSGFLCQKCNTLHRGASRPRVCNSSRNQVDEVELRRLVVAEYDELKTDEEYEAKIEWLSEAGLLKDFEKITSKTIVCEGTQFRYAKDHPGVVVDRLTPEFVIVWNTL
jgi:hypothetical protein